MALVDDISKACYGIKLEEVECYARRNWFRFSQNESQKVFGGVYIKWMCFKNKSKVIKGNNSNDCSQDTDFNPQIHILSLHWLHLKLE